MAQYASLDNIASYWKVCGVNCLGNKEKLAAFLPDIVDESLVSASADYIHLGDETVSRFLHGNYKEPNNDFPLPNKAFGNKSKTQSLLTAIKNNSLIVYGKDIDSVGCMDNMLHKLYYLVLQSKIEHVQSMLEELELLNFLPSNIQYRTKIKQAISKLSALGTKGSCTYAVFLLVLSAIFRDWMKNLEELYCDERIGKVVAATTANKIGTNGHVFFTDPKYMGAYNVFMYRTSIQDEDRLYDKGTLIMEKLGSFASAKMELEDCYTYNGEVDPVKHNYSGIPMASNGLVYIVMSDECFKGNPGILCFKYEDFQNGEPMYFRYALFVSGDVRNGEPQVQRAIIATANEPKDDITFAAIKGLLRTNGEQIFLTKEELENFIIQFSSENWMNKFISVFKSRIESSSFEQYWIDVDEILRYKVKDFTKEQLVQIAYALKDFSDSKWLGKDTHLNCIPPEHFHRIMK